MKLPGTCRLTTREAETKRGRVGVHPHPPHRVLRDKDVAEAVGWLLCVSMAPLPPCEIVVRVSAP